MTNKHLLMHDGLMHSVSPRLTAVLLRFSHEGRAIQQIN